MLCCPHKAHTHLPSSAATQPMSAGTPRRKQPQRGSGPAALSRVVAESEDAAAGALVLSPSRHLPPFALRRFAGGELSPVFPDRDSRAPGVLAGRGPPWTAKENAATTSSTETTSNRRQFSGRHCFAVVSDDQPLFRRIMDGVKIYDDYFRAKVDALGKASIRSVPDVDFEINGHHYTKGYYLADGIYPPWATLVKTIRNPTSEQEARFAKEQEAARKDVERAFGIFQARWAIVRHPARAWDVQTLWEVMTACVIMHNMIVEVERDDSLFDNDWEGQGELVTPQGGPASFQDILHAHHEIRDLAVHNQL
ncbi:hypothetical protein QYE76_054061 [Lolium multiflorum]|uniref:Uncharacterized protein n=1 Tax=Lolium multiflorum TaxID=4521 RepID=A0AAD8WKF8_LOLMU|nr:hypothetical protein QYE76_054061 [Lolium multiflorum]